MPYYIYQGVSQARASQANIETARLPIDEYMEKAEEGTYKKVLSVNQGMCIHFTETDR